MLASNSYLRADLDKFYRIECRTSKPGFFSRVRLWIVHFGLHSVVVYRFGQFARRIVGRIRLIGIPLVALFYIINYFGKLVHHVDIASATIGPGFYISHGGMIFIGPITIGRNFSITHNVTIGVGHTYGERGTPSSIGDNVWIGTGSVISGNISIGDNVTVSSGCILSRDLPSGCLAAGNPGRVVQREYDNHYLFGVCD